MKKFLFLVSICMATVTKVGARIGRVLLKFDSSDKEEAIAFGDVMKT